MRKIIHIDMDCFYAAVEVKKNPFLRGKAIGIGGPANSRSVLCTASYEARKFGVRAAMPSSQALRLCPELILVPPDFASYKKESDAVRKIFERFTNLIEPLSLDEAYLDVTDCKQFNASATLIAFEIRRLIFSELQLTASAGIAPNKFLAKIASDWKKPNGQFVIRPEEIADFVRHLPVEKIFGVGQVTAKKMHQLGLKTCQDIQNQNLESLLNWFGRRGHELYRFSRGQDDRAVETSCERKSFTVEQTYTQDILKLEDCLKKIPELYSCWQRRFEYSSIEKAEDTKSLQPQIKSILIKLKFCDFKSITRNMTINHYPQIDDFKNLFVSAWNFRSEPVRLIGLGVSLKSQKAKPNNPIKTSNLEFKDFEDNQLNFAL